MKYFERKDESQNLFVSEIIDCKKWSYFNAETPNVRKLIDSQHNKGSETLLKSARQYLSHIFWSLWEKITSKNSVLVVSETLKLFVNILTPDDKYSLSAKSNVKRNEFKCYYPKIKKIFPYISQHFQNINNICKSLKQKISLTGYLFLKL